LLGTFEFCRRFQGALSALAARGRIPQKRMRIRHAEQRAEKRDDFPVPVAAALIGGFSALAKTV
jgi:hypothetical protein